MKIVTAAEMREIDRITTEKYGVPSLTLMENAGSAVAEFVLQEYPEAKRIGVICGKGNNGGDGLVAARKLHEAGKQVEVLLLADPAELKGDAAAMYKKLPVKAVVARNEKELKTKTAQRVYETDVIVDAILGTGFKPPVRGLLAAAIRAFDESDSPVVAVDIPSGVDADAMGSTDSSSPDYLRGAATLTTFVATFTSPKLAEVFDTLVFESVVVVNIGTPVEAIHSKLGLEVITNWDVPLSLRSPEAHKGDFGHALIVGGSLGKSGSAAMAGMAAMRSGVGLVTIATPRSVLPTVAGFAPELMTEPLAETEAGSISLQALEHGRFEGIVKGKSVVALGPGISRHPDSAEFARNVVKGAQLPVILDADGLNAFEGRAQELRGNEVPLVLTPHPGEMGRLTGLSTQEIQRDRIGIARRFADEHNCIVVLKGHRTLVAEPGGTVWVNTTGNSGMATGGTGDVLTGMIAGLVAQGLSSFVPVEVVNSVCAAVYLHGLAGDLAARELGQRSLVATDLLRFLPGAFQLVEELRYRELTWLNPVKFDPVKHPE